MLVCEGDTAFLSCAAGFEVEVEAAELGWSGDGKMSEGICRPQHEQCVRSLAIEDLRQWRKLNVRTITIHPNTDIISSLVTE